MCGGLETANERDLGVEVVHGCFAEGDDSILRVFLLLGAPVAEATRLLTSFFGLLIKCVCKDVHVRHGYGTHVTYVITCLLYTSPSPRDATLSRMPSSA